MRNFSNLGMVLSRDELRAIKAGSVWCVICYPGGGFCVGGPCSGPSVGECNQYTYDFCSSYEGGGCVPYNHGYPQEGACYGY